MVDGLYHTKWFPSYCGTDSRFWRKREASAAGYVALDSLNLVLACGQE